MSRGKERKTARRNLAGLSRKYTEEAIETLVAVMRESKSDTARLNAASELLDRGHGKATAVVESEVTVTHDDFVERAQAVAGITADTEAETCH